MEGRLPGWCYLAGKALARSSRGLLKGKKSPHQVGLFTSHANLQDPKTNKLLKEWTLVVTPFGLLKARLPCHITVGPLDPHKYPDSDKVFVALKGRDSNPDSASDLLVNYDEARKEVMIISSGVDGTASWILQENSPPYLDIKTSGNGSVKIEEMQCANCKVETEKGASVLKSIKSHKIDLRAKGGNVTCLGTLQGNTDILVSQESNVNIEKLQGSSINVTSENGLLKAKYLYANSSFLTSAAGDILLGNVHGKRAKKTSLKQHFSTKCLFKEKYSFSALGDLQVEPDFEDNVPATLQTSLKLSGRKVEINPEIQLQEMQTVSSEDRVAVMETKLIVLFSLIKALNLVISANSVNFTHTHTHTLMEI
uniref:Family with sequence similarity 185 member A n=1 Tax=Naja naja TaxID=35670 RepID=A0A8C6XW55_NAJNA